MYKKCIKNECIYSQTCKMYKSGIKSNVKCMPTDCIESGSGLA